MTLLRTKRLVAAEIETTAGTPETLVAADAAFIVYDVVINADISMNERPNVGSFGSLSAVQNTRAGSMTFMVEMMGSGSGGAPVPTWAEKLLPICGLVDSANTFSPSQETVGSNVKTGTVAAYMDGRKHTLAGAQANLVIRSEVGGLMMAEFTVTGKWVDPIDASMLSPTLPTVAPHRYAGVTTTIGGSAMKEATFSIDLGNDVQLSEDSSDATGFSHCQIVNRQIVGTIDPESVLVATSDRYGAWKSRTEAALSVASNNGVGNTITITSSKLQYQNLQDGERNGKDVDSIDFALNEEDLSVVFS